MCSAPVVLGSYEDLSFLQLKQWHLAPLKTRAPVENSLRASPDAGLGVVITSPKCQLPRRRPTSPECHSLKEEHVRSPARFRARCEKGDPSLDITKRISLPVVLVLRCFSKEN